jgi:hypothetical protein
MSGPEPGEKRRFLLELWLEPRAVVSHLFRLRGVIRELASDRRPGSIGELRDVDEFVQSTFAGPDREVRWETEP